MSEKLWVGQIDERSLVYDPHIQLTGCDHLFLWDPETKEMRKYVSDLARQHIRTHDNVQASATYIAAYEGWKASHIDAWLNETRQYYENRRAHELAKEEERALARLNLEERHKLRLEKLGKGYLGVRAATHERLRRVTHCYACKHDLDNAIDVECVACSWILCSCGACGCGYSG